MQSARHPFPFGSRPPLAEQPDGCQLDETPLTTCSEVESPVWRLKRGINRGVLAGACGTPAFSTPRSTSPRTRARPAIEFVSGEEGLRPKSYFFLYVFLKYTHMDALKYVRSPGSSCGAEETKEQCWLL